MNLTETGKLMVMGFRVSMSGAYTCTLSHKVIETTTQEEIEMVEAYKFMVYGKIVKLRVSTRPLQIGGFVNSTFIVRLDLKNPPKY